jgi:protein-tyrosine phosphatase
MYVDLHLHLLPGIDDGAADLDAAITHVRRLEAVGVRDVACTPHVKRDEFPRVRIAELAERRAELEREIARAGLGVRVHGGGELGHVDALELSAEDLELIAQGPEHARWLLLESPFEGFDDTFVAASERLRDLGYGRLVAHPERSAGIAGERRQAILRHVTDGGARLQVNVCSLMGRNGPAAREMARRLVRERRAFCLASDGHPGTRECTLEDGHRLLLREGLGEAEARRLTQENPRALLRGAADPPPSRSAARSWSARRRRSAAAAAC